MTDYFKIDSLLANKKLYMENWKRVDSVHVRPGSTQETPKDQMSEPKLKRFEDCWLNVDFIKGWTMIARLWFRSATGFQNSDRELCLEVINLLNLIVIKEFQGIMFFVGAVF